jgi:hypothetical protein
MLAKGRWDLTRRLTLWSRKIFFLILAHPVYKMQHLEVSGVVRPIYGSLGVKRLKC